MCRVSSTSNYLECEARFIHCECAANLLNSIRRELLFHLFGQVIDGTRSAICPSRKAAARQGESRSAMEMRCSVVVASGLDRGLCGFGSLFLPSDDLLA